MTFFSQYMQLHNSIRLGTNSFKENIVTITNPSLLGKITIIKSLALSKINQLILALPNPSKQIINEVQRMIRIFME